MDLEEFLRKPKPFTDKEIETVLPAVLKVLTPVSAKTVKTTMNEELATIEKKIMLGTAKGAEEEWKEFSQLQVDAVKEVVRIELIEKEGQEARDYYNMGKLSLKQKIEV